MHDMYGMEHYSKNPYPLRYCIIPNEATVGTQQPRGCRPSGSWATICYIGNYVISHGYGCLLLSQDPLEWKSLGVGKSRNSQHPFSTLILTLVIGWYIFRLNVSESCGTPYNQPVRNLSVLYLSYVFHCRSLFFRSNRARCPIIIGVNWWH